MSYYFSKILNVSFDEAILKVTEVFTYVQKVFLLHSLIH